MKKWLCLIAGLMVLAATVEAGCGSCEGAADKAKDKAACEMKAGKDKAECAMKKGECAKDKAACEMKKDKCCGTCKGDAAKCTMKKDCDKDAACAPKCEKKWYNPLTWFK